MQGRFSVPDTYREKMTKSNKNIKHNSRPLGRDLNPKPPEHKAGVLRTYRENCCVSEHKV
jgi:hypothetical protein